MYGFGMPKLWSETIEAHRHQVRAAVLDTAARLVTEHGLLGVTMSQIAEEVGIGRATLYKYFSGIEEILRAWHERQVSAHLEQLAEAASGDVAPLERLSAVLGTFARIQRHRADNGEAELVAFLHDAGQLGTAEQHLRGLVESLVVKAAATGDVRDDVPADELVNFCLHALAANAGLSDDWATERLVVVTLDALRAR